MIKYIIPFLMSFLITVTLIVVGIYAGKKIKWKERNSLRHIHKRGVPRIGGIAMIAAFNLAILLNNDLVITPGLFGVMAASLILLIVGIRDDLKEVFWKTQLFYQIAAAILVFIAGVRIYYMSHPLTGEIINFRSEIGVLFSAFLVIGWMVLIMNSMNWLDGIDGLSGGITLIGAATIFLLSLKPEVNQPPMAILAMILAGTALGFLIFNFNPARVLAGTTGSMFMGFALAVLAIFAGTKIATSVLVLSLPLIDFLWVIKERIKNNQSIFSPDKKHLHYKLLDLNWSQKKIAYYFYVVTILISLVAINTRVIGKGVAFAAFFLIMALFLAMIDKKLRKSSIRDATQESHF